MQPPRPETDPHPVASTAVVIATEDSHGVRPPQPTLLRWVGGITLLERTVRVLREAGVSRIVVVVGDRAEDVAAAVKDAHLKVELVVNDDWEQGTSTSVRAGLGLVQEPAAWSSWETTCSRPTMYGG